MVTVSPLASVSLPRGRDVLELLKPYTWFPPIWAFACGVISSGAPLTDRWPFLIAGALLTGPLVCGTSQAVNDWFDRHVDAINEPRRPIPSGRIAGTWGLRIAIVGTLLALLLAAFSGPWVLAATALGLVFAWIYSAPPLRLKADGWAGPALVALSYEGLAWFTGATAMLGGPPPGTVIAALLLYSFGTHGIMTLNDFKAVAGDRATGVRSLPVRLGVRAAARIACAVMTIAQVAVSALLFVHGHTLSGAIVAVLLAVQFVLMPRLLGDPVAHAEWYNRTGVPAFVVGMMVTAVGLGSAA